MEHNIGKYEMLKKALFYCELEEIEGSYFEFGIFEGSSLFAASQFHRKMGSKFYRNFYGFDSFEEGFKYFLKEDVHPFFKEGDFSSSYRRVKSRFTNFQNVILIPGLFENSIQGKSPSELFNENKCAIIFIDCDLMSPAKIALDFIKPILQPGSILILDDFWAFKGSQKKGTCGALESFKMENQDIKIRNFVSYGHGGMSFVVEEILEH